MHICMLKLVINKYESQKICLYNVLLVVVSSSDENWSEMDKMQNVVCVKLSGQKGNGLYSGPKTELELFLWEEDTG